MGRVNEMKCKMHKPWVRIIIVKSGQSSRSYVHVSYKDWHTPHVKHLGTQAKKTPPLPIGWLGAR